jgi:hypothetical protein
MATTAQRGLLTSLYGFDPVQRRAEQQAGLDRFLAAQQTPQARMGAALGSLFGQYLAPESEEQTRVAKVNNIYNQVMADADPTKPTEYLERLGRLAQSFQQAGLPEQAEITIDRVRKLTPEPKRTVVAPGATVLNERGEVVYTAPDREKNIKPSSDFAQAAVELGFGARPNLDDYNLNEARAINSLIESRGIRRAEAGVPTSGEVKITDLSVANKLVTDLTGAAKDRLNTVSLAKTQLNLAKKGEGAALPQLQRQLVKLVGDSQIGQGEVRDALGSSGIVGDTISAVNKFMTGVPTADKLNSVEQVINALENINAQSFNKGRAQAEKVLGEAKFSEDTRKALLPPAYKTAAEKKASKQGGNYVEGKIYVDAKGNRARYVNGNFVSVE